MPTTGIEPTTFYLQSGHANHYATEDASFSCRLKGKNSYINISKSTSFFLSPLPSALQLEIDKLLVWKPNFIYLLAKRNDLGFSRKSP